MALHVIHAPTRRASGLRRCAQFAVTASGIMGMGALIAACSIDERQVSALELGENGGSSGMSSTSGSGGDAGALGGASGAGAADGGSGGEPSGGVGGEGTAGASSGAGGGDDAGGGGSVEPDAGPGTPELPPCASALAGLGSTLAQTLNGPGSVSPSCASGVADDVSFLFVAERDAYYRFDTLGSDFDTVLALLSPACDGAELACNGDGAVPPQSELVHHLGAGESVVVVVDGNAGSFGSAVLGVSEITCPGIDLDRQPLPLAATTLDGTDTHGGACGGDGQREKAFRYQAPSSGLYQFSVTADTFTPALYVERGPSCGGELLGCNAGAFQSPAVVTRELAAGDIVTLLVDGVDGAGAFEVDVSELEGAACPAQALGAIDEGFTATLDPSDPSLLTGSCVPFQQRVLPGGTFPLPEHSYPLTVGSGFQCNLGIVTDGPVAVYVLDGLSCGGAELSCELIDGVGVEQFSSFDLGDVFASQSFDYVVVVEATNPIGGPVTYTLFQACFII